MEHNSYFEDFLKDVVNIDQGRLNSLDTSITAIQNYILKSNFGAKVRFFRRQGSLAHGTIVRPLNGQEFDADVVMMVAENAEWEPKDYLLDLRRVLWANSTYRGKTRLSDVCVTLDYAGDKKIDLMPMIQVSDKDHKINICHHRHNHFIRSEPLEFTEWLVQRNKLSGGNSFRKMSRILKYIRNHKKSFTCPSVLLTALIGYRITDNDRGTDAFSSVPKTLVTILERLDRYLARHIDVPEVLNPSPSIDYEDLGELWTIDQFRNFKDKMHLYASWARDALLEEDHNASLAKWRKLLGNNFGAGKEKTEAARNVLAVKPEAIALANDAGHSDSLVEAVMRSGVRILNATFYRPPHLRPPTWTPSHETASCYVSATFHRSGRGSSGVNVDDGSALPRDGWLRFKCTTFQLQYDKTEYFVQWRVTNTGFVAKLKGQMRGEFYDQDGQFIKWEKLSYRGVHFVEAFVIRKYDNTLACKSAPYNVVIK
ncbi:SMODS domain-containing nucleotidyltransferase [Sulfitobacter delicatus]|uniref:Adenylyl/Guanylyl and SMODS C-terminal sensor domain-containing protein n=1 Tax=Sulfitobacter delicatus TaxID=218672 RepID=A0A1G7U7Q9_9RHOB|nr:nucleotidyltransferase [Sulfitobacter delicatus]SDG43418.1 hypothetical protein SAMN04489759_107185 [Sulfitobacter delicatus]